MRSPSVTRPEHLDRLPQAYGRLFDSAVRVFAADERVRALWVGGSLARGDADASSDLDLLVALDAIAHEAFASSWREWLARITPTVFAEPLPFLPGSVHALTPDCLRLDVICERVDRLVNTPFRVRACVFERDDLDAHLPAPDPPTGPRPERVRAAIREALRSLVLLPEILERGELLVSQEGYAHVRRQIGEAFVEANAPVPTTGVKRWADKLDPDQHEVLRALPWPSAERGALIEAAGAYLAALTTHLRPLADRLGVDWPEDLETAVRAHLARRLGLHG